MRYLSTVIPFFALLFLGLTSCDGPEITPPLEIRSVEYDATGNGEGQITLFNPADLEEELDYWELRDNDQSETYVFPEETTIGANSTYIVQESVLPFPLLPSGQEIELYDSKGIFISAHP